MDQRLKDFKGDKRSKEYKELKALIASEANNNYDEETGAMIFVHEEPEADVAPVKTQEELNEAHAKQTKGIGDTVDKVLKKTGIKKLVEWATDGKDCGCDERKEKLNELYPYNTPQCLTEAEYTWLDVFLNRENQFQVTQSEQVQLLEVYNRVLHYGKPPTSCANCIKEVIWEMTKVYNTYQDNEEV